MNNYDYQPYIKNNENYLNSIPFMNTNSNNDIFAENILKKNKGKKIKVYMSFSDSIEWRDRIFEGLLLAFGKDFILLKDQNNNKNYMIWNLYIDFIEFNDDLNL